MPVCIQVAYCLSCPMKKINLNEKFGQFNEHWSPRIIGETNGQQVKLAKVKGELVWHDHANEDELFLIIKGTLILEFRDRIVELSEGEILIVPNGVEHLPRTKNNEEVWLLLIEPASTLHTGEVVHEKTNNRQEWI